MILAAALGYLLIQFGIGFVVSRRIRTPLSKRPRLSGTAVFGKGDLKKA